MRIKLTALVILAMAFVAMAAPITPDFGNVPTGWVTDRYQPADFSDVGPFAGRDPVLGIQISEADGYGSRPSGFNSSFYNTQGMQYALSGGIGDSLSADLWVPREWQTEANGSRRTDMWGVMVDSAPSISHYPIIGFTNFDGSGTGTGYFRIWDGAAWVDLINQVNYDDWNAFEIRFTGSSFDYYVNGVMAYSDPNLGGSVAFSAMIMQAYNFTDDPSFNAVADQGLGNYTAYWSNTASAVPEPGTFALVGLVLPVVALWRRRR